MHSGLVGCIVVCVARHWAGSSTYNLKFSFVFFKLQTNPLSNLKYSSGEESLSIRKLDILKFALKTAQINLT